MAAVTPPRPLREADDTSLFDCGREAMNAWFHRHAWSNHNNDISRINVITETASGRVVGYVTLSSTQIERAFLPKPQQRHRPAMMPATLLGQLAIDKAFQGQGHAAALLLFALRTALRASDIIASAGVVTHPIDDDVRRFYARWGFQDLPFDPRRAMFVRTVDLDQSFAADSARQR